jgi:phosphomevalonate decarboxylase
VQHEEPTENVHAEVTSSPLFQARVDYIPSALAAMKKGLASKDIRSIAPVAERDTLNLHAVTMTAASGHITWMPPTLEVIHTVRRLRRDGVPVWFSIDTGATAYLNTDAAHEARVADAVKGIPGVSTVLHLRPAGAAHLVDEPLF